MTKENEEVHKGIPTIALVAAHNYNFTVSSEKYKITIPRTGIYQDLDKELLLI